MKRLVTAAAVWMVCLSAAQAVSLGRARGAAIVGRPLDLSIPVTWTAQDGPVSASCFAAEVFYGDVRVPASQVQIGVGNLSTSEFSLNLRASESVNEPVVTVYLRATCGSSVSRRYVLLADAPTEQAATGAPTVLPWVTVPDATGAPSAASTAATPSRAGSSTANAPRADGGASGRASRPRDEAAPAPAATPRTNKRAVAPAPRETRARDAAKSLPSARITPAAPKGAPRLQVDLLDLAALSYDPMLRSSREMISQPGDEATRTQAAALWRVLNTDPAELLRDTQRLANAEAELNKLKTSNQQQVAEISTLRTQLTQANKERFANPLVYGLGALSLLLLGGLLWAWRRQGSGIATHAPWWQRPSRAKARASAPSALQDELDDEDFIIQGSSDPAPLDGRSPPPPAPLAAGAALPPHSRRTMPSYRAVMTESDSVIPSAWADIVREREAQTPSGFSQLSGARTSGSHMAEELLDIQQQADFFMTLGQPDQAIEVLRNHISENIETSALAYIDLFDIYHQTSRRSEYNELRDEFNRVFNAEIPEFERYSAGSRGLAEYRSAMSRIESLWPAPKVLEVIEESIFRKPDRDSEPFDMLAYRELMLLYSVAKELNETDQSVGEVALDLDLQDGDGMTQMQPLPTSSGTAKAFDPTRTTPLPVHEHTDYSELDGMVIPSSNELGVDVDLAILNDDTAKLLRDVAPSQSPATDASATDRPTLEFDFQSKPQAGKIIKGKG